MNSVRAVLKGGLSIFQSDGFGAPFVVIRKDDIFCARLRVREHASNESMSVTVLSFFPDLRSALLTAAAGRTFQIDVL